MYDELYELAKSSALTKNSLLEKLKKYSREISIFDLMEMNAGMIEDGQFVHESYRKEYLGVYAKYFLARITDIKNDKTDYDSIYTQNKNIFKKEDENESNIDLMDFRESVMTLKSYSQNQDLKDKKFSKVYSIISLYTTYVLEEPIHPVGTLFPGSLRVTEENGVFYCPVKDANEESPNSVCTMCIAVQLEF